MAGILSAIKFREAGYTNFVIYEKSDALGGTWRANTYPGLACDVPAHLYTYSFEPNPDWSHIDGRWQIRTNGGLENQADVVIAASGVLHHPNLPDIPGLDTFGGACFHSAEGDHSVELDADSPQMKEIEAACLANLEDNVRDAALREKLRPDYRAACKRLIMSPNFVDLDKIWEDHPVAYLSISIPEFPNFFMLNGPNGPVGNFSLIRIAELQLGYIMQLVDKLGRGECRAISARRSAATDFETARAAAAKKSIWATGCKSWYLDKHGVPASWPWSRDGFDEEMAAPKFEAYDSVS
jgi:cation diffusion facilitator CzcD-associated flavoprotein CzcO